jgi:hypothetical protein
MIMISLSVPDVLQYAIRDPSGDQETRGSVLLGGPTSAIARSTPVAGS